MKNETNNLTLTEKAYILIKEKIIKCKLMPGKDISEVELCEELEMSRTPVREALLRLQQENLVRIYPRKGIIVSPITLEDINEVFQIRKIVETYVAKNSCRDMSEEHLKQFRKQFAEFNFIPNSPIAMKYYELDSVFHKYIVKASNNSYLIEFVNKIYDIDFRIRVMSTFKIEDIEKRSIPQHLDIIDALLEKNVYKIEKAIIEHLDSSREVALKRIY